jgi:hypothetical protein
MRAPRSESDRQDERGPQPVSVIVADSVSKSDRAAQRRFRDTIRGSRRKQEELSAARQWLPPALFSDAIGWLNEQPALVAALPFPGYPRRLNELGRYAPLTAVAATRELRWADAVLLPHARQLSRALALRDAYAERFLLGNFEDALACLDECQEEIGISYWWIQARIATLQAARGIEAQKAFAMELKAQAGSRSIQSYIVHQTSVRNEPSVTPTRFIEQLTQQISGLALPEDWRDIGLYYVTGGWPTTAQRALNVLRHAGAHSVLDYYDALLNLTRVHSAWPGSTLTAALISVLRRLGPAIADPRVDSLLHALSAGEAGGAALEECEGYKELIAGNDDLALAQARTAIQGAPLKPGPYLVAAYCPVPASEEPEGSPAAMLERDLRMVLRKGNATALAAASIRSMALNLPGLDVGEAINAIALRELLAVPVGGHGRLTASTEEELRDRVAAIKYAFSPILTAHPLGICRYAPGWPTDALCRVEAGVCDTSPAKEQGEDSDVDVNNAEFSKLEVALKQGDYLAVAQHAALAARTENRIERVSALTALAHALLQMRMFAELTNLIATGLVEEEQVQYLYPIRDLADSLGKSERRELGKSIDLAILYEAYSRFADNAYEAAKRWAVADALRSAGVSRPSEIAVKKNDYDLKKLVYFLDNLCVPQILYVTGTYSGSQELKEERIATLRLLGELNPDGRAKYDTEIVEHTRSIVLQARRVEVENSKIQIDFEGWLRQAEKSLRESYERYLVYVRSGVAARETAITQQERVGDAGGPLLHMAVPVNEAAALFNEIVKGLRDIFIGGQYYGLEFFLGTRIRHAVLEGELRSALLAQQLLTPRDPVSGHYPLAEPWQNAFADNVAALRSVEGKLDRFGREYDALVREIKDAWIRVKQPGTEGLINMEVSTENMGEWAQMIARLEPSFEEFASAIFTALVKRLEPELAALRTRVENEAKERATNLLVKLESELDRPETRANAPRLLEAVREARPQVRLSFDRVAGWLKLSYEVATEPLPVADVLQIGIEMYKRFNPKFEATVDVHGVGGVMVDGPRIALYTDILLVLFDNVAQHAGLGERPTATVRLRRAENAFRCECENALGADVDCEVLSARAKQTEEKARHSDYTSSLRREGGTGLLRIHSIVQDGMLRDPELTVRVAGRQFVVAFSLPE